MRSGSRRADDLQPAVEQFQALVHAQDAKSTFARARRDGGRIKTAAIVGDGQAEFVSLDAEFHIDVPRMSVPAGVAECFLCDAIAGQLYRRRHRQPERRILRNAADTNAHFSAVSALVMPLLPGGGEQGQRFRQSTAIQRVGTQVENRVARLVEMFTGQGTRALQAPVCEIGLLIEDFRARLQVHFNRSKPLSQRIMNLARDTLPFAHRSQFFGAQRIGAQLFLGQRQLAYQPVAALPCRALMNANSGINVQAEQSQQPDAKLEYLQRAPDLDTEHRNVQQQLIKVAGGWFDWLVNPRRWIGRQWRAICCMQRVGGM